MEQIKELTPDQLKVRQIAEYYLELQRKTEPLTHIVRYNSRIKKHALIAKMPTDHKHFFALIVQLSYLLYSCFLKKINIFVGGQFLVRPPRKGQHPAIFEVYIEYILDKEHDRMSEAEQQSLARRFKFVEMTKSESIFGQFVCYFIVKLRGLIKGMLERGKGGIEVDRRQMEGLVFIIENFLQNQIKNLHPSVVILTLEQSQLFRQYSYLLKCFNNSLFVSINFFHASKKIYSSLIQMQQASIKKAPSFKQVFRYAQHIEALLEETFKMLLTNQIIKSQYSLEDTSEDNKQKQYMVGDVKGTSLDNRKYSVRIFVKQKILKPFDQDKLQQIKKNVQLLRYELQDQEQEEDILNKKERVTGMKQVDKKYKNQCHVQFYAAKSMLSVKYITNVELNIQNTDNMVFHCNYMSQEWENICLEFVQKSSKSRKKERFLAFKTICYIGQHQKIILKMLTMIDLLIVYAKVAQPLLKRHILNLEEYYARSSQVSRKCKHLRELFIDKIEECYWNLNHKSIGL